MLKTHRSIVLLLLVAVCLACGCGSDNKSSSTNFPVVVFSDVHFNPLYDSTLYSQLVAKDYSEWGAVFQSSSITTPPAWGSATQGSDTNYPLLVLSLANIKQNLGASPLIIFTGDMLGHGIQQQFYPQYYANLGISPAPTTHDATAVAAMKSFTDKTVAFFMDQVRTSVGNIPVLFAVGNIDGYANYGPNIVDSSLNPDNSFLVNTVEYFYTKFLNGIVDHQEFLTTFTAAGYYAAEPTGTNLMVIGLNTVIFTPSSQNSTSAATAQTQLDWFDTKLASAKAKGKKVWLLMHAPPGADIGTTNGNLTTSNITTAATMMWVPGYQTTFLSTVANYPGLITQIFAGHTHMDEYRILPSSEIVEITPGITPWMGNNPAFKVYTFSGDTYKAIDYSSLNYDLSVNPAQFSNYYTFSAAYSMQGLLNDSLTQLNPMLVTNFAKQSLYKGNYFSGHNYTVRTTPFMVWPITYANWPVVWCGMRKMDQADFVSCVNSY